MAGSGIQSVSYAIDFGTSNTVITRWNPVTQQPETIALDHLSQRFANNPPLVPSLIYVEDAAAERIVVGQTVRDRGLDLARDPRFFRNIKRGIGATVKGFLPELDGRAVSFEQAGQWFLEAVIRQLQQQDANFDSLIFTVPVDSFESYRYWLGQICAPLQISQVRMIDEPTAAALGYGLANRNIVLVIDFGGGTLDLSLVRLEHSQLEGQAPLGFILKWGQKNLATESAQRVKTANVLAKAGQNLGGADIDDWIAEYLNATRGVEVSPLTLRLAERLKIQLSTQRHATEVYFNDETLESYELTLDRDRFNAILYEHQFFERLDELMTQVLRQARRQGIEVADVDAVLLVGGTAQIPAVRGWVERYFEANKVFSEKPFEAIAHGALQLSQGIELKDFLYHGYGIRYWNRRNKCHDWHPIIREGQPYPMAQPVELVLGASVEQQPSIELVIGELGADATNTEVYFDGDRLVTRTLSSKTANVKPLNDQEGARSLAKLNPPGIPGSDRVKLLFWVDADRILRVTVEDLLTNQTVLENQAVVQLS
jgi:molecular chaperone DnaK (HSP70)